MDARAVCTCSMLEYLPSQWNEYPHGNPPPGLGGGLPNNKNNSALSETPPRRCQTKQAAMNRYIYHLSDTTYLPPTKKDYDMMSNKKKTLNDTDTREETRVAVSHVDRPGVCRMWLLAFFGETGEWAWVVRYYHLASPRPDNFKHAMRLLFFLVSSLRCLCGGVVLEWSSLLGKVRRWGVGVKLRTIEPYNDGLIIMPGFFLPSCRFFGSRRRRQTEKRTAVSSKSTTRYPHME